MTLVEAIKIAQAADDAYQAAVIAAGYKSRWDVPSTPKESDVALYTAYMAKLDADKAMHDAFVCSREH